VRARDAEVVEGDQGLAVAGMVQEDADAADEMLPQEGEVMVEGGLRGEIHVLLGRACAVASRVSEAEGMANSLAPDGRSQVRGGRGVPIVLRVGSRWWARSIDGSRSVGWGSRGRWNAMSQRLIARWAVCFLDEGWYRVSSAVSASC
jgi:hypothetical protein